MKLTDALLGEHGAFYVLFDQLEEIASIAGPAGQILGATTVLAAMVDSHAKLEEELLFSALEPHLGKHAGPLAVMRAEHEAMERLLGRIADHIGCEDSSKLAVNFLGHGCTPSKGLSLRLGYDRQLPRVYGAPWV